MIEAQPVTAMLRTQRFASQPVAMTPALIFAALLIAVVCLTATIVPLRMALRTIEKMEW
jgi:hypothetical protein